MFVKIFILFYCSSGLVKPPFIYNGFTVEIKYLLEENSAAVETELGGGRELSK